MLPSLILSLRLPRLRTARSVADPHRCGVPRSRAADPADRRRRPDRGRGRSGPLRHRPHLERRRAVRGARDHLRPGPLRGRACAAGTTPSSTSRTWRSTGWPARSSIPRRGSSTSGWPTRPLMSAIFRAYNDWLAEFCRTDPARLKGIAMINLDDVAGRHQGAGARRPPRPRRRDDHRVSARAPALRPARVRAVLGRRRGARHAAEPAHGHATAGQDPRRRRARRCATPAAARPRRSIRRCRCAT